MAMPGSWVVCRAGDRPPAGAVRAPGKFNSIVCLWREKDHTFGRASCDLHSPGLDAWFPYGGLEHAASTKGIQFSVLVDDGTAGYVWLRVCEVMTDAGGHQPFQVHGFSPIVADEILGKGSITQLKAWTSYGGVERGHQSDDVMNGMILCRRVAARPPAAAMTYAPAPGIGFSPAPGFGFAPPHTPSGWREIIIKHPPFITANMIRSVQVAQTVEVLNNPSDMPTKLTVQVEYKSEDGQEWTTHGVGEICSVNTVIKAEKILRDMVDANIPLGLALYGKNLPIEHKRTYLERSFTVPPRKCMTVQVTVFKQETSLKCPATESTFDGNGSLLVSRQVQGQWRGVSTEHVKVEITETCKRP